MGSHRDHTAEASQEGQRSRSPKRRDDHDAQKRVQTQRSMQQLRRDPLASVPSHLTNTRLPVSRQAVAGILGSLFPAEGPMTRPDEHRGHGIAAGAMGVDRTETADAPKKEMTREEAEKLVDDKKKQASANASGAKPAPKAPPAQKAPPPASKTAGSKGQAKGGSGAKGKGEATADPLAELQPLPPDEQSTLPTYADLESGPLSQYANEKSWHEAWAAGGRQTGMGDEGTLVLQALGTGATEGLVGGVAAALVGQVTKRATGFIPFGSGFMAMGEMLIKGQNPGEWLVAQGSAAGAKVGGGWDKLWGGDSDWIDRIEGVIDIVDGLNDLIGTLATICYIVAAVLLVGGLILSIIGVGAGLLALAPWFGKAGMFLSKINAIVGLVVTALRLIVMAARSIQIMTSEADPETQAKRLESLRQSTQGFTKDFVKAYADKGMDKAADRAKARIAGTDSPEQNKGPGTSPGADEAQAAKAATADERSRLTKALDFYTAGGYSDDKKALSTAQAEGWGFQAAEKHGPDFYREKMESERAMALYGGEHEGKTSWPMAGVSPGDKLELTSHGESGTQYESGRKQGEQHALAGVSDDDIDAFVAGLDESATAQGPMGGMTREQMGRQVDAEGNTTREAFDPALLPPDEREGWRNPLSPPGETAYGQPGAPKEGPFHGAMGRTDHEIEMIDEANAKFKPVYRPAEESGVTPDQETYAVRVGDAGSYYDHIFNTREEAVAYAEHLSRQTEGQIRQDSALPKVWPGGAKGNPVKDVNVFEIPPNTPFSRSGIAPQPESAPGQEGADYAGGGPQVQVPYDQRIRKSSPVYSVPVGGRKEQSGSAYNQGARSMAKTDQAKTDIVTRWEKFRGDVEKGGADYVTEGFGWTGRKGEGGALAASSLSKAEAEEHRKEWAKKQLKEMEDNHRSVTSDLEPPPPGREQQLNMAASRYAALDAEERRLKVGRDEVGLIRNRAAEEKVAGAALQSLLADNRKAVSKEQGELDKRAQAQVKLDAESSKMGSESGKAGAKQQGEQSTLMSWASRMSSVSIPGAMCDNADEGASAASNLSKGFTEGGDGTKQGTEKAKAAQETSKEFQTTTTETKAGYTETDTELASMEQTAMSSMQNVSKADATLVSADQIAKQKLGKIAKEKQEKKQLHRQTVEDMAAWAAKHESMRTTGKAQLEDHMKNMEETLKSGGPDTGAGMTSPEGPMSVPAP